MSTVTPHHQPHRDLHPTAPLGYLLLQCGLAATNLVDATVYPLGPPWTPSAGLALATLLLGGRGYIPLVILVNAMTDMAFRDLGLGTALTEGAILAAITAGAVEALIAVFGLSRRLENTHDMVRLLMGGVVVAGLHGFAMEVLFKGGGGNTLHIWLRLWAADLLGIIVVTPFVIVHVYRGRIALPSVENLLEAACIALTLWIDFGLHAAQKFRFFYLLFMPLVWIATRHGLRGISTGVVMAQFGLMVAIGLVPLRDELLTLLQVIMLTLSATTLLLGAMVSASGARGRRSRTAKPGSTPSSAWPPTVC